MTQRSVSVCSGEVNESAKREVAERQSVGEGGTSEGGGTYEVGRRTGGEGGSGGEQDSAKGCLPWRDVRRRCFFSERFSTVEVHAPLPPPPPLTAAMRPHLQTVFV